MCVLPISNSNNMIEIQILISDYRPAEGGTAASFFQRYIAPDHPFQQPMLGANQQRAALIQRFRITAKMAIARVHRHIPANGDARCLPLVRQP